MTEPVVLINSFEVPAADAEEFIAAWERTRDYLQTQPGYIDTALHQAVAPEAEFQFVNVARWRSVEEFAAATRSPGMRLNPPRNPDLPRSFGAGGAAESAGSWRDGTLGAMPGFGVLRPAAWTRRRWVAAVSMIGSGFVFDRVASDSSDPPASPDPPAKIPDIPFL